MVSLKPEERIRAARLLLVRERPYLAAAAWAITFVPSERVQTMAADKHWRVYYNPERIKEWTTRQIATALYHEICHLLFDHHHRLRSFPPNIANLGGDAAINDIIRKEAGIEFPSHPIYPETLGMPAGLLAEEYAAALLRKEEERQKGGQAPNNKPNDEGDGLGDSGNQPSPEDGDSGTKEGGVGEQNAPPPSSSPEAPSQRDGDSSSPSRSKGEGGQNDLKNGDQDQPSPSTSSSSGHVESNEPAAGGWDEGHSCGSCAHGRKEPWEVGPPEETGIPGVSEDEGKIIARKVAQEIIRIAQSSAMRGTIPGHWKRWAEDLLHPKVDWRRALGASIRKAMAYAMGAHDYTYQRPNRRQAAFGDFLVPSLRWPLPNVAVVIDTSGSMSDEQIAQAIAEIGNIIQALGHMVDVRVLSVDAMVQACQRIFRPQQITPVGGGGTDMRVGIEAALRLRPRPDIIVVITDGYTPWPEVPPAGVRVIVALVGDGQAPTWAQVIKIGRK